jgi:DNA-directed RNA polymerase subunit alpha
VDSIYTPVRQVNHWVEATRVDHQTLCDRLVLEVWTNGALAPNEALSRAARILEGYYRLFFSFREAALPVERELLEETREPVDEWSHSKIEDFEFTVRTYNCLKKENINSVGDLLRLTEAELTAIRNFGRKSLAEVIEKLTDHGLTLRGGMSSKEALEKE